MAHRRNRTARDVMAAAATVRLAYGLAAMFAPRAMAGRLAAAEADSVMNLRGFGGQHIAIAVFTLAAARSSGLARPALLLNVGVDLCDVAAGAFEVRERGASDVIAVGGVALPGTTLAAWLTALARLDRGPAHPVGS